MSDRRKPGQVRDAIIDFLRKKQQGAPMDEIHQAVERTLGSKVARSSVRSYLNLNAHTAEDRPTLFVRIGRGTYRLKAR